jgi:hypothetical protein
MVLFWTPVLQQPMLALGRRTRCRACFFAVAVLASAASVALANDEPDELVPGTLLLVRAGTLAKVVARPADGPDVSLPAVGNPTVDGASIRFFDTVTLPGGGAGDVTYHLDASGWRGLGKPAGSKGFRYRGKEALPIDDVCKLVVIRPRRIEAVCRSQAGAVPLTPPFLGPAGVTLTIGTAGKRYCTEFGGAEARNDARLTKRVAAPAPSQCSEVQPPPSLEPLEVHSDAQWVRDRAGRVMLLRGANYSGLEFGNFIGHPHGPEEADFVQMESWGFNVIRLPIAWNYLEPLPNALDESYLTGQVDPVVDWADRHGMLVVPEMHQFQWSPCFTNGNGAPAWTCADRGYSDDFNGVLAAACDFFTGATAPDGRTLMDHFVDAWRLVARHFAGDRRIAGFDFFNEPPGLGCAPLPPGAFERDALIPFYRRLRQAVQDEGADPILFFDPPVFRNLGVGIYAEPIGPNVVYAPHLYTETFGLPDRQYDGNAAAITDDYTLAQSEATTLGGPLVCGEYGGNTAVAGGYLAATERFVRDTLAEQDRRLIGGAVWAYFPSDNTFSVVDADGNPKGALVDILTHPYARRIAGVPLAMSFDSNTGAFAFSFQGDPAVSDPTEIFLPPSLIGTIAISDGSYERSGNLLLYYRGASATHEIDVLP